MDHAKLDFSQVTDAMEHMTGYDFYQAEKECRSAGDFTPDIAASKLFQAKLAARALNVPEDEISGLNIKDFNAVTTKVGNFLYGTLIEERAARQTTTAKSPLP